METLYKKYYYVGTKTYTAMEIYIYYNSIYKYYYVGTRTYTAMEIYIYYNSI